MKRLIWLTLFLANLALAAPSQIIVLRHGEKENDYALCGIGQQRALALKHRFLGKNAEQSLFSKAAPSAFFATTLHTLELIASSANSWGMPVFMFPAMPMNGQSKTQFMDLVTSQTQLAAQELMQDPKWHGKTVVMVWELKHIANQRLVDQHPDTLVELRQLLKLHQLPDSMAKHVPKTWSGANYNFFWVIDYDEAGNPIRFNVMQQNFTGKFAHLPNNAWGEAERLPAHSKCKRWKGD